MNKEKYKPTELEVIRFETEDVIMTSGNDPDEYEDVILKSTDKFLKPTDKP